MTTIQDPRLKNTMKVWVLHIMYEPYVERRKRDLMSIVQRNQVLQKTGYEMFSFRGSAYGVIPPGVHVKPKLHPELHDEMQGWILEEENIRNQERPYVNSYITLVLNLSHSPHDWLRLFPSAFHEPITRFIQSSPVNPPKLSDEQVADVLAKNQHAIDLMRQRMARNLLHI